MEGDGKVLTVVIAYAPKVGCDREETEKWWAKMYQLMEGLHEDENPAIGAKVNGHDGDGQAGDERVMGKFGYGAHNEKRQAIIDFAHRMNMAILNPITIKRNHIQLLTLVVGGGCKLTTSCAEEWI